jgi:hypothetical protein
VPPKFPGPDGTHVKIVRNGKLVLSLFLSRSLFHKRSLRKIAVVAALVITFLHLPEPADDGEDDEYSAARQHLGNEVVVSTTTGDPSADPGLTSTTSTTLPSSPTTVGSTTTTVVSTSTLEPPSTVDPTTVPPTTTPL